MQKSQVFVVSAKEQEKVKSTGMELDSEFGRLTHSFLQGILSKYCHSSGTQAGGTGHIDSTWPSHLPQGVKATSRAKSSDRGATSEKSDEQEWPNPQSLKRSTTTSTWKPTRRHSNEDSVSALVADKTTLGLILLPKSSALNQPRRAQTLPLLIGCSMGRVA
jgi:hypothetical protein